MSEEKQSIELVEVKPDLDTKIQDLATKVVEEENPDKTKDLVSLFNWNIAKKNISRVMKLNTLYDNITDQMIKRFETRSDQFSNSDLLEYMKAVQTAIDTSSKNLSDTDSPTIVQTNNTQINVNVQDSFDRDAKERILAAVQATLHLAQASVKNEPQVEAKQDSIKDERLTDSNECQTQK